MFIRKLTIILLAMLFTLPVWAEEPVSGAVELEQVAGEEPDEASFFSAFEKPERQGPATATDKIVDRFMELNTNPEESAGVDFEEYFTMVMQRAMDRFEAMDINQDDEVTAEEYREFWKAQKAKYYRLKR